MQKMSPEIIHNLNMLIGLGAILTLQIPAILAIVLLVSKTKESKYLSFLKKYFIQIGFLVSLSGLLVSGFYSEVLDYAPCFHCWVQRVFLFPQVFLYGVAWLRKDRNVFWYSLPLTLAGITDSLYLCYKYYLNPNSAPCDATGVSCVQQLVSEFGGYITIPSLALSGFVALLTLLAVVYFYKKNENI